jgi:hypothetical protein
MASSFGQAESMTREAKDALRKWCAEHLSGEGLLAVGGGFSDGETFTTHVAPEFVLAHNEELWREIAATLAKVRETNTPGDDLVWQFEGALLCSARRNDGAWLGVFLSLEGGNQLAEATRMKLDEFRRCERTP